MTIAASQGSTQSYELLHDNTPPVNTTKLQFTRAVMPLSCLVGVVLVYVAVNAAIHGRQQGLQPPTNSAIVLTANAAPLMLPVPAAKQLVNEMDTLIGKQFKWDDWHAWHPVMAKYFAENFTYDYSYPVPLDPNPCTLCDLNISGSMKGLRQGDAPYHGLKSWWSGEHVPWNVAFPSSRFAGGTGLIFAGFQDKVTLTTYAKSYFVADFKGIPHKPTSAKRQMLEKLGINPNAPLQVDIVDLDFYFVGHDKNSGQQRILVNWCDGDLYGMMVQTGRKLIKHTGLPEGIWYPPRTMDGLPAPASEFATADRTDAANAVVKPMFLKLFLGPAHAAGQFEKADEKQRWIDSIFMSDAVFYFNPYGLGFTHNPAVMIDHVLRPLIWRPFSSKRVVFDMAFCESYVCGAHGKIIGLHVEDFMGIPPKDISPEVEIRFGCHLILALHRDLAKTSPAVLKIRDGYCLFDLVSAVLPMGRNLILEAQNYK